jgi:uncharacterized protein (DUF924 family)
MGTTPDRSLTLILLLDQLSRNSFRDSPFPFTACDPLALSLVEHFVLQAGHDKLLPPWKRIFYYLPFQHAENISYQELGVSKFAELAWELRDGEYKECHGFVKIGLAHAWDHLDAISKFGRFPRRNAALGRENTEAETKYLAEHKGPET